SRSSRVKEGWASASSTSASAKTRTAAPRERASRRSAAITAMAASAIHSTMVGTRGVNAIPYCMALLPQPFDQRRHMHLVGLVVAGQRVHHDVDAGAEREFALAHVAAGYRQHRLAVGAQRPGAGEIV